MTAKDKRLENPTAFWPDVPGYLVPMLQSQARTEERLVQVDAKFAATDKNVRALWAHNRGLPCQDHAKSLAVLDTRLAAIEKGRGSAEDMEDSQGFATAVIEAIASRPKTMAGVVGAVLTVFAWMVQQGMIP